MEIENDGKCRDIIDLKVVDSLPGCLEYANTAVLYHNGEEYDRPPDTILQGAEGAQLLWELGEIGALEPGESVAIEYDAIAEYPGGNVNLAFGSARCAYDYSVIVSEGDTATVIVAPEVEPPAEEVLYAGFEASAESVLHEPWCTSTLSIFFEAQDLTGGAYPVTEVILKVNGEVWYDSGTISTVLYQDSVSEEVGCGETFHIELRATNENGQTVTSTGSITTPVPS